MSQYQDITNAKEEVEKQRQNVKMLTEHHQEKEGMMKNPYGNYPVTIPQHFYKTFKVLLLDYYQEKLSCAEQHLLAAAHDLGDNEGDL